MPDKMVTKLHLLLLLAALATNLAFSIELHKRSSDNSPRSILKKRVRDELDDVDVATSQRRVRWRDGGRTNEDKGAQLADQKEFFSFEDERGLFYEETDWRLSSLSCLKLVVYSFEMAAQSLLPLEQYNDEISRSIANHIVEEFRVVVKRRVHDDRDGLLKALTTWCSTMRTINEDVIDEIDGFIDTFNRTMLKFEYRMQSVLIHKYFVPLSPYSMEETEKILDQAHHQQAKSMLTMSPDMYYKQYSHFFAQFFKKPAAIFDSKFFTMRQLMIHLKKSLASRFKKSILVVLQQVMSVESYPSLTDDQRKKLTQLASFFHKVTVVLGQSIQKKIMENLDWVEQFSDGETILNESFLTFSKRVLSAVRGVDVQQATASAQNIVEKLKEDGVKFDLDMIVSESTDAGAKRKLVTTVGRKLSLEILDEMVTVALEKTNLELDQDVETVVKMKERKRMLAYWLYLELEQLE